MIVDLYCFCWNEADMLGFLFKHYDPYIRRYIVYDMGSTDTSLQLLREHPRVEVRPRPALDADLPTTSAGLSVAESSWQASSMDADWVIITDVDEHLHHRDFGGYLRYCKAAGITIVPALGYQMVSTTFPERDEPLTTQITKGAPWVNMSKLSLFDPKAIDRLNFSPGRHSAAPTGRVIAPRRDELLLLHYKYLDFERVLKRHEVRSRRLNAKDIECGFGHRWRFSREELREDWVGFERSAVDVSRNDLDPWSSHQAPRWWEQYRSCEVVEPAAS